MIKTYLGTRFTQDSNKMLYKVELENGAIVQVKDLAVDSSNWTTYCENIFYVAKLEGVV
jgi:hypothetical protein